MLYVATVFLKIPEEKFWKMAPRKLRALCDIHLIVNGQKETEEQKKEKRRKDINWLKSMAGKV